MFKLIRFLKPYWWQVVLLLIATGGEAFLSLQIPAKMAEVINDGIMVNNTDFIWRNGVLMIVMALLAAGCSVVSSFFSSRVGARFSRDLRAEIYAKILSFNLADTKDFSTASLITRTTNDVAQVQDTVMAMLSLMLFAPMFCIFAFVMAVVTAPDMSWIIALGVSAILLIVVTTFSIVVPKFKVFQKLVDRITLITRENLTGLRVIRAFNNEELERKKFEETNGEMTGLSIFIDKVMKLTMPMINIIFNGTTLLCSWVGITLLEKDFSYLGNMAAFAQYVGYVMMSFLMLSMLFVMLPRANVSAGRINEILKREPKIKWMSTTVSAPRREPEVEFRNVSFKYSGAGEKVLDDVSFVAKAGETTAFIGSTGSGKSTLVNLVPRFYEATEGEVLINGVNVKDYAKEDLMKKIGLVPQKGVLFAGTIESNIRFGAAGASFERVKEAAKVAQAEKFIEELGGYKVKIAQGGTNVSGGQKQRLSIARAICKDPDVFVFDDAFSALDMKTDVKLREALAPVTQGAVVLIVAQRVSTIKHANQIVVLDKGKVVGKGTHGELLKKCRVYQSIVESQLSEAEFKKEMEAAEAAVIGAAMKDGDGGKLKNGMEVANA